MESLPDLLFRLAYQGLVDVEVLQRDSARLAEEMGAALRQHAPLVPALDVVKVLCRLLRQQSQEILRTEPRGQLMVAAVVTRLQESIASALPPPSGPAPAAPAAAVVGPRPRGLWPGRTRGVWPGTYPDYTKTPEFRRIAAQAKRDWKFQCAMNVNHRGPVEMHHRTYAHVPFGEDWWDLIPLCEECHARHHLRLPAPPRGLFDELIIEPLRRAA